MEFRHKKILIAPDSFKNCLSSIRLCDIIAESLAGMDTMKCPLSDGGEGSLALIHHSLPKSQIYEIMLPNVSVKDFSEKIKVRYLVSGDTVFIESAQACGLERIPAAFRNPIFTSTFNLGILLKKAITRHKPKKIYITLGGSATNDAGVGMAMALGYKFLDSAGNRLKPGAAELIKIKTIRPPQNNILRQIKSIGFTALYDVRNELLGKEGATFTYALQKGAQAGELGLLEKGMINFNNIARECFKKNSAEISGAGAAGGLGAGSAYFLNAQMKNGAEAIMKIANFQKYARDSDLIITGEGKIDAQTKYGKVVYAVCKAAKKYKIPVIAIGGTVAISNFDMKKIGAAMYYQLCKNPALLNTCIMNTPQLLRSEIPKLVSRFLQLSG